MTLFALGFVALYLGHNTCSWVPWAEYSSSSHPSVRNPTTSALFVCSRIAPSIAISVLMQSSGSKIQNCYPRSLGSFCQRQSTHPPSPLLLVIKYILLCLAALTSVPDCAQFTEQCSGINTPPSFCLTLIYQQYLYCFCQNFFSGRIFFWLKNIELFTLSFDKKQIEFCFVLDCNSSSRENNLFWCEMSLYRSLLDLFRMATVPFLSYLLHENNIKLN